MDHADGPIIHALLLTAGEQFSAASRHCHDGEPLDVVGQLGERVEGRVDRRDAGLGEVQERSRNGRGTV